MIQGIKEIKRFKFFFLVRNCKLFPWPNYLSAMSAMYVSHLYEKTHFIYILDTRIFSIVYRNDQKGR